MSIHQKLKRSFDQGHKRIALLVDPDKMPADLPGLLARAEAAGMGLVLVGGSLVFHSVEAAIEQVKRHTRLPVVIFPGSLLQISDKADGIMLLSLISGRNADFLIGNHVVAAPFLRASQLEILPTGYMLIEGGRTTSVEYMSNTRPIPRDKPEIAMSTAMAGEMLGLRLIYMDAGSGAAHPVPEATIRAVKGCIGVPLVVGGGLRSAEAVAKAFAAGADMVVVGTAIEQDPSFLDQLRPLAGPSL